MWNQVPQDDSLIVQILWTAEFKSVSQINSVFSWSCQKDKITAMVSFTHYLLKGYQPQQHRSLTLPFTVTTEEGWGHGRDFEGRTHVIKGKAVIRPCRLTDYRTAWGGLRHPAHTSADERYHTCIYSSSTDTAFSSERCMNYRNAVMICGNLNYYHSRPHITVCSASYLSSLVSLSQSDFNLCLTHWLAPDPAYNFYSRIKL